MNSIYIMADSGARGSQAQIRQLAGMRGLMAKPDGSIIETPITANFREGLNVLQYFISTHGARKGLADTALKTANSGYLTRRLVDVAQDVVVTETDCGTLHGLTMTPIVEGGDVVEPLRDRVLGRMVAEDVYLPGNDDDPIVTRNTLLDEKWVDKLEAAGVQSIKVRSTITCESTVRRLRALLRPRPRPWPPRQPRRSGRRRRRAVDRRARHPADHAYVPHRRRGFACGGGGQRHGQDHRHGQVQQPQARAARQRPPGRGVAFGRTVGARHDHGRERERYKLPYGAVINVKDGASIKAGQTVANWDPHNHPIVSEVAGFVRFIDFVDGVTVIEKTDELTGLASREITDPKRRGSQGKDLRPIVRIVDDEGQGPQHPGHRPAGAVPAAAALDRQPAGRRAPSAWATWSPRCRRKRPRPATSPAACRASPTCSKRASRRIRRSWPSVSGIVSFGKDTKGKQRLIIKDADGNEHEELIPKYRQIIVFEGEHVEKGETVVDGEPNPQDILRLLGVEPLAAYLVKEIQDVYRLQGVKINDKHIETIIRQMLRKVEIIDAGDTKLHVGRAGRAHARDRGERQVVAAQRAAGARSSRSCWASPRPRWRPSRSSRRRRSRKPPAC